MKNKLYRKISSAKDETLSWLRCPYDGPSGKERKWYKRYSSKITRAWGKREIEKELSDE